MDLVRAEKLHLLSVQKTMAWLKRAVVFIVFETVSMDTVWCSPCCSEHMAVTAHIDLGSKSMARSWEPT